MNRPPRPRREFQILLVDDNDDDVELTRIGFERIKLSGQLHRASNGEEGLEFLRREGAHAAAPRPDLVLLDLNMPRMGGLEVLRHVRADERLRSLVVVILTTSYADHDVRAAYDLGCNAYMVKPVDFDSFLQLIRSITDYWLSAVVLRP